MEKKMMNLTDLQLTMVSILESKGVRLEEYSENRVTIDDNSIRVVELNGGSDWNSTKEYSVSIEEEAQTISIISNSCLIEGIRPLEFDENETRWWESRERIAEMYQIVDGKMQYSKTVHQEGSKEDSLGGGVLGGFHTDEETSIFELPEGYKINDGINAFTNLKAVKILSRNKKSNF